MGRGHRAKTPDEINLMVRKGDIFDLENCLALHDWLHLPYTKATRRIMREMWRYLLSTGALQLFVVENRTKSLGSQLVSFGGFVFVIDDFCAKARSTLPPYLSVELARRYSLRNWPILRRDRMARANSDIGLNVLMCFQGWVPGQFSPEESLAVLEKHGEALHLTLRGYRIKELLAEPIGRKMSQWMFDAGARLRRDYSNYFRDNHFPDPKPSPRPLLVGLTIEEALAHPGANIGSLFVYTPPRFHFSRSERVLLQHALMGKTCEQLASSLSLSRWTVKQRWHAIYDRVGDVDSDLLPPSIAYGAHACSRGAERRRRLLNYLRQHLEELRP